MKKNTEVSRKEIVLNYLTELILNGELKEGEKLPTEAALCEKFNVSRTTVRSAIDALAKLGLVYKIQGGGTFLGSHKLSDEISETAAITYICEKIDIYLNSILENINGITDYFALKKVKLDVVYMNNNDEETMEDIICNLIKKGRKDFIIRPSHSGHDRDFFFDLSRKGINFTFIDILPAEIQTNFVSCDNYGGGFEATKYLIEKGYKRIAYFSCHDLASKSEMDRYDGYTFALSRYGIEKNTDYIKRISGKSESKFENDKIGSAVEELLNVDKPPDVIFCCNDVTAVKVFWCLNKLGKKIPQDIGLLGFDNSSVLKMCPVSISSMKQPLYDMGYKAAQIAFNQMVKNNHIVTNCIFPVSVVEKESTMKIYDF